MPPGGVSGSQSRACLNTWSHTALKWMRERTGSRYRGLSAGVLADIADNNAYWQRRKTVVSKTSDAVYTGFLHSYGQTLGMQTYGACVDLLVAYYYNDTIVE